MTAERAAPAAGQLPAEAAEWLLAQLAKAMARFGRAGVGLLDPATFPQHAGGGVGILICCERARRGEVAELLELMGCAWTADHDCGVEAHLAGRLRPAPAVVVRVPLDTAVLALKRCRQCARALPAEAFGSWGAGRRAPYCPRCCQARTAARRALVRA